MWIDILQEELAERILRNIKLIFQDLAPKSLFKTWPQSPYMAQSPYMIWDSPSRSDPCTPLSGFVDVADKDYDHLRQDARLAGAL